MMVELKGFGVSCRVELAQATSSDKLLGEDNREAKDFVKP